MTLCCRRGEAASGDTKEPCELNSSVMRLPRAPALCSSANTGTVLSQTFARSGLSASKSLSPNLYLLKSQSCLEVWGSHLLYEDFAMPRAVIGQSL